MVDGLIAANDGTTAVEGAGAAGDLFHLGQDVLSDALSWNTAFDAGLVGIDVLSSMENPLGALIASGVGWLLEHVPGLSDVWDKLTGSAAAIEQIAGTWDDIARSLSTSRSSYVTSSQQIERWSGPAATSYRQVADGYAAALGGASAEAEALAIVVRGVGALVATLKDVVYTLIADFVEFTVLPAILGALATAWCTFGASVAAAITYIEIQADVAAGQITLKITKTTEEILVISERAAAAISKLAKLESALKKLAEDVSVAKDAGYLLVHDVTDQAKGGVDHRAVG